MTENQTEQEKGISEIRIITKPISRLEAQIIGDPWYKDIVKGVVDIEQEIIALGGEYHMDSNVLLLEHGSAQDKVWGFNIYPNKKGEEFIEYISLINIRPAVGNCGMEVEDEEIRKAMRAIIDKLIV
jgi:hypothetical protein